MLPSRVVDIDVKGKESACTILMLCQTCLYEINEEYADEEEKKNKRREEKRKKRKKCYTQKHNYSRLVDIVGICDPISVK